MTEPEDKPTSALSDQGNIKQQEPEKKPPLRRKIEEIAIKKRQRKLGQIEYKKKRRSDTCAYCGRRQATTTEHFIPQSSGLEIAFKKINLIPACKPCNSFKGGRWPNEKEIRWFFDYWEKQLQEVENHLKIAVAVRRTRHGKIEEGEQTDARKRRPRTRAKRRHRRR